MSAKALHLLEGERSKGRSLFFSLICPGMGQLYRGNLSAALAVAFLRTAIPLIPAVYLYDSRAGSVLPVCAAFAVFFLIHLISCIDAWFSRTADSEYSAVSLLSFFLFSWFFTAAACAVFLQLFPVKKLNDSFLYPSFYRGEYVLCSVRAVNTYHAGDTVLYRRDGVLTSGRIAAADEADYIDCVGGKLSFNGDELEQAPAGEVEKPGNEHFFKEKGVSGWYSVYRSSGSGKDQQSFHLRAEKNMFLIAPDNRIDGTPCAVPQSAVGYRIEASISVYGGGFLSAKKTSVRRSK